MINKTISFLLLGLITVVCSAQQSEKETFISPFEQSTFLSATFAELRNDHFHSGLDLKTGGVTGKEVKAAADGYVYRINVSPTGYGKAIYVRHANGYSTVYAHLDRFRPDIEQFVTGSQYEMKNYTVTLYPDRDQFTVKKGETIAWSGNSGGSTGPHLHFEVRQSSTEEPVNPLIFDLGVKDHVKPAVDKIIIYPITSNSSANRSHKPLVLKASGSSGKYTVLTENPVAVNGLIGIGIKCWDSFDDSSNKCGVYSINVSMDSVKTYGFEAGRFSFSESRYLNSHIDYRAKVADNEYIHKLFLEPGNRLSMYNGLVNRGVLEFSDENSHQVIITVSDEAGNKSTVSFRLKSLSTPPVKPAEVNCTRVFPYGKAADFASDGIKVHFPPLAFYDTLFFIYKVTPSNGRFLSPIHSVHNDLFAVHDLYRLSIRPDTVMPGKEDKMCIAKVERNGARSFCGGDFKGGFVSSEVRLLGDYAVTIDSVRPDIRFSFAKGSDLTGRKSIIITISDDFSGIRSYDCSIDGTWALLEYDPKNNRLTYHPDNKRIKENSLHKLELQVTDNRGNSTIAKTEFTW